MKGATLKQARKILEILDDTPAEQIQAMIASGALADVRDANYDDFDRDLVRRGCGLLMKLSRFSVWQTIIIGGQSKDELIAAIINSGMFVSDLARDIMGKDTFITLLEPKTVRLARCKVKDLGFVKNPTTTQIFERIKEIGGELCPPEVGPHLRLHLKDQPKGDIFWLAMETITDSDGDPSLFRLARYDSGESGLNTDDVRPDSQWFLELVFVLKD